MLSRHRIEKCTLQITLPRENNLEVVRLLAQEKPRILDAILAVFDQQIPGQQDIHLSKIHLDLGTVPRRDFIRKLTERLVALLSAELKHLASDPAVIPSPPARSLVESSTLEKQVYHRVDESNLRSLTGSYNELWQDLPDGSRWYMDAPLRWPAVTPQKVLFILAHYFRYRRYPRAFEALQATDIDMLVNHLADTDAPLLTRYLSRRIGSRDFQVNLTESLQYNTLLKVAYLLPVVNISVRPWLDWIAGLDVDGISTWKHTPPGKLLLLQYLTEPSAAGKTKLQEVYLRAATTSSHDHAAVLLFTGPHFDRSVDTTTATPLRASGIVHTTASSPDLRDVLQALRNTPVLRHGIVGRLDLPALRAIARSMGLAHGSYAQWQAVVGTIEKSYLARGVILPDSVLHTLHGRYLDLISTHDKSSLTFERLKQLLFPALQRHPDLQHALPRDREIRRDASVRPIDAIASNLRHTADIAAKQPDVHAFVIVRFYYQYGYFPREAHYLQAADLEALMLYLFAWNSEKVTQYMATLLRSPTFRLRLAETLSAETLKTILSASGSVADALAEWALWEQVLEFSLGKTSLPTLADKIALLQYLHASTLLVREGIIYEYLMSRYALQGVRFVPDVIVDAFGKLDTPNDTATAARTRIVGFLEGFSAREDNSHPEAPHEGLRTFRQYVAVSSDAPVEPLVSKHPAYADWIAFQTRVRGAVADIPAREDLLNQLPFLYFEFLRRHGHEPWSPERFQRYMMQEVDRLLAALVPAGDIIPLRLRIDAAAVSATLHWKSILAEMIRHGIAPVVTKIPALQHPSVIDAFWDTALDDETAVFALFYEADVNASFWPVLAETLSFAQLHRLLSILAPFQYQSLLETGVLSENVGPARSIFSLAFKTLHPARYAIGTQKLILQILRGATPLLRSDDVVAQVSDVPIIPGSSPPAGEDSLPLTMLVRAITTRDTAGAREHWGLLYRQHRNVLLQYVRTQWPWIALRTSLARDADLDVLTGLASSLGHDKATYDTWQNFIAPYRHQEHVLRQVHRHYFEFLSHTSFDHSAVVLAQWLEDHGAEGQITQRTDADHDVPHDVFPGSTDGRTIAPPAAGHSQNRNIKPERELPPADESDVGARDEPVDDTPALLAALHAAAVEAPASAAVLWQSLYRRHPSTLVRYIRSHGDPEPLHDSLAFDANIEIVLHLSALLYQDDDTYPAWLAFTDRYRDNALLLRKSYRYYFGFLRSVRQGSPPAQSFTKWLEALVNTVESRRNDLAEHSVPLRSTGPARLPHAVPSPVAHITPTSAYDTADVIVYYLKTGKFIPGGGATDAATLTTLTAQYFSETRPADNLAIAAALDSPEAYRRLTPLLSPIGLSLLHEHGSAAHAPLPHYTTSRIKTLQQIEATLHYWLYGQWPWWYTPAQPPAETLAVVLENHLELLVQRLEMSGHEVVIVQKILSSLSPAVFRAMIVLRFPSVAGFVKRVLLLLEKMLVPLHETGTLHLQAMFSVVYEYLAHHADPFSALHFLAHLARHGAAMINVTALAWIDSMLSTAATMLQEDRSFWSLQELLISLRTAASQPGETTDGIQPVTPAIPAAGSSALPVGAGADGSSRVSLTFKEAFVAYLRMGIIPVHTQESQGGKTALMRQLQTLAVHESAWLSTTLKSLFMNTAALDEYILRADPSITIRLIRALAGTRRHEFTRWRRGMERFLAALYEKPTPLETASQSSRALLQLLLQRPGYKITAIQYAQTVFDHGLRHKTIKGPDILLEKIRQYKAANGTVGDFAISLEVAHAHLTARARTSLLQSLTNPHAETERTVAVPEKGARIAVAGAGVVLMAPFFYMYFNRLDMTEDNRFKSDAFALRAVHLLHYLVSGGTDAPLPSHALLYKLLCGVDFHVPLDEGIVMTDHEKQVSESLLQGVLQNWTSLKSKSVDSLRETFLQRAGHLEENDIGWSLTVERRSADILVDWIPWSFSLIKLSWMEKSLTVNWQSDQYRDLMLTQT
ncbi:contractile injection system tape measure protein [Dawidia soli]|uniref:Uncharacterized protein n=1 Tax=Dawidia soli TaxID=2782352 RepID=A0AAP2GD67_9BACT|nr:contractile injection system tape measure protein [Dawidia soli]MBT1686932.1 hypothetical protein [Dawidia soli]